MATIATPSTQPRPNPERWAERTLATGRTPVAGHRGPVNVLAALVALFRVVFGGPATTGLSTAEVDASVPWSTERGR
jgi:hypothetical protein